MITLTSLQTTLSWTIQMMNLTKLSLSGRNLAFTFQANNKKVSSQCKNTTSQIEDFPHQLKNFIKHRNVSVLIYATRVINLECNVEENRRICINELASGYGVSEKKHPHHPLQRSGPGKKVSKMGA